MVGVRFRRDYWYPIFYTVWNPVLQEIQSDNYVFISTFVVNLFIFKIFYGKCIRSFVYLIYSYLEDFPSFDNVSFDVTKYFYVFSSTFVSFMYGTST